MLFILALTAEEKNDAEKKQLILDIQSKLGLELAGIFKTHDMLLDDETFFVNFAKK